MTKNAKKTAGIKSKSSLAVILSSLDRFQESKVRLEQYNIDGETAADMLWKAYLLGDIEGKTIVDLGAGTGILGLGAALLGAEKVSLVDIDKKALNIAKSNISRVKSESYRLKEILAINKNIEDFQEKADVVVENPPFGTKKRHNDIIFLKKALGIGNIVYSIHKSETKGFISGFLNRSGYDVTHVWDYQIPLRATYKFHKKRIYRIKVSCFRVI